MASISSKMESGRVKLRMDWNRRICKGGVEGVLGRNFLSPKFGGKMAAIIGQEQKNFDDFGYGNVQYLPLPGNFQFHDRWFVGTGGEQQLLPPSQYNFRIKKYFLSSILTKVTI